MIGMSGEWITVVPWGVMIGMSGESWPTEIL